MESLKVNLGDRSYPIQVGAGILDGIGKRLQESGLTGKVAVVTNPTVAQLYLDAVHGSLQQAGFEVVPILVPDGEEHKTLKSLTTIYNRLITERCERKSSEISPVLQPPLISAASHMSKSPRHCSRKWIQVSGAKPG